jgi:uncharacterized caspase-like protein
MLETSSDYKTYSKLHAILVGINKYKDERISTLRYACKDAEDFGDLLKEGIHPSELDINVILNEEATKEAVIREIGVKLPKRLNPDALVLLYFACHGSPEIDSTFDNASRYLVMHDTDKDSLFSTAIDMERDLKSLFERLSSRHVIIIIDACFSGKGGGRTFEGPKMHHARSNKDRGLHLSLKDLYLGEGRYIITACADDQVARESSNLGHGIFTYQLMRILKCPCESNTIPIPILYYELTKAVRIATNGLQIPIFNGRMQDVAFPCLA